MKTVLFTTFLVIGPCLAAQDAPDPELVHPYQHVIVPNLAFTATQDTSSSAVAEVALEIVLSGSKVKCDLNTVPVDARPLLRALANQISGVSCSSNGHSYRVNAIFTPNGAIQADNIIASIMEKKPLLMEWKSTLYVLYGVVYDEHLHNSGRRNNVVRELRLIDPRYLDNRRVIAFEVEKDDFAKVEGIMSVSISQPHE